MPRFRISLLAAALASQMLTAPAFAQDKPTVQFIATGGTICLLYTSRGV